MLPLVFCHIFVSMKFAFFILFTCISVFINAQVIDFERVHPQDTGWACTGFDIVVLDDSNYLGVGYTVPFFPIDSINITPYYPSYYHMIFRINSQGDSVFIKNIDFGNQNFFNLYGHYPSNTIYSMVKISENSFMATGYTQTILPTQNEYDVDCIFHKFDSNGDSLMTHAVSVPDSQIYGMNIIKTSNNYLMAVGFHVGVSFGQLGRGDIMKLDTMGNLIWHKVYGSPSDMHFSGIVESPDGGFIIAAQKYNGTWYNGNYYNPVMIKIDSSGSVVWQKVFPSLQFSFLQGPSITRTSDDFYIFSYPDYAHAPKHFKFNENGDTLWADSVSMYYQNGTAMQPTFSASDNYGGIIAIATVQDTNNFLQGAIYRLSGDDSLLWHRKFGTNFDALAVYSVKPTLDNGFIVTGGSWCCNHIWPSGGTLQSLYVIKFDSLGLLYPPVGIEEPVLQQAHIGNVFPNPCNEQTTISVLVPLGVINNSMKGEPGARLLLFDIRGSQLQEYELQTGLNTVILNVSSLASGEYLCVLSLDGYNAGGKKLIVQR